MMGELSSRLAGFELRFSEAAALILIDANPLITPSQLGRMLDIQRANMVPLLNRLDQAGLISRQPINAKSQGLSLSATGVERLEMVGKEIAAFEQSLLNRVPAEHRHHLLPALDALWR